MGRKRKYRQNVNTNYRQLWNMLVNSFAVIGRSSALNALRITEHARRFPQGRWSLRGPGSEKKWYGTHLHKPDGEWDKTAEGMMLKCAGSRHPACRATGALERGELKKQRKREFFYSFQR